MHEAQKGPHVFLLFLQQAGYPPKQSPIPWDSDTRQIKEMATMKMATEIFIYVDKKYKLVEGWIVIDKRDLYYNR